MSRPNFFKLLEIDLNEDDEKIIEEAIKNKKKEWTKKKSSPLPNIKNEASINLNYAKQITEIMLSKEKRAIERASIASQKTLDVTNDDILLHDLGLLKRYHVEISEGILKQLSHKHIWLAKEVLKQKCQQFGLKFSSSTAELIFSKSDVKYKNIRNDLAFIGYLDLYDLLQEDLSQNIALLKEKSSKLLNELNLKGLIDQESTLKKKLYSEAIVIFSSMENQKNYRDDVLSQCIEPLSEHIHVKKKVTQSATLSQEVKDFKIFGIDLGTTYSCISGFDEHQKPYIIKNKDDEQTTPSVVYFETNRSVNVGQSAKELSSIHPSRSVSFVKRSMGNANALFLQFNEEYTPQEISGLILKKIVQDTALSIGTEVKNVVITCPAYFGANQREATKQAAQLIGLNVINIIPEPVAAAIYYSHSVENLNQKHILVYDLGGGTFDITLVRMNRHEIEVLSTSGDHELGGKNWDEVIHQMMMDTILTNNPNLTIDELYQQEELMQDLQKFAEEAKKKLSEANAFKKILKGDFKATPFELTRESFQERTKSLLESTVNITDAMLSLKKVEKIDTLLLVGGSTFMPQVKDILTSKYPHIPIRYYEPNTAIAKGAAIYGYQSVLLQAFQKQASKPIHLLSTAEKDEILSKLSLMYLFPKDKIEDLISSKITNVSSKSFGLEILKKQGNGFKKFVQNLIVRDEKLPVVKEKVFKTTADKQTGVQICLYENQSYQLDTPVEIEQSTKLSEAILKFPKPLPIQSEISVFANLSIDGILEIKAIEKHTQTQINIEIQVESILNPSQFELAQKRLSTIKVIS